MNLDILSQWTTWIRDRSTKVLFTGSRAISDAVSINSDIDYLLLVTPEQNEIFQTDLPESGFELGGSFQQPLQSGPNNIFQSWKREFNVPDMPVLNLILTQSPHYYLKFSKATRLARLLNLTNKQQRIALFEAILHNQYPWYPYLEWSSTDNVPE